MAAYVQPTFPILLGRYMWPCNYLGANRSEVCIFWLPDALISIICLENGNEWNMESHGLRMALMPTRILGLPQSIEID